MAYLERKIPRNAHVLACTLRFLSKTIPGFRPMKGRFAWLICSRQISRNFSFNLSSKLTVRGNLEFAIIFYLRFIFLSAIFIAFSAFAQLNTGITKVVKKNQYQVFQISEPKNRATIFDNQGIVAIKINLQPSLRTNDQILIYLDNKKITSSQKTSFNLQDIDRGKHSLQAKLINHSGNILQISNEIIFYLHKAIVQ